MGTTIIRPWAHSLQHTMPHRFWLSQHGPHQRNAVRSQRKVLGGGHKPAVHPLEQCPHGGTSTFSAPVEFSLNFSFLQAGFILATAIPFITTSSPKDSGANYNQRGTYICIVASFGLIAGGIIVGSSALIVLSRLQRRYAINVSIPSLP